MPAAKGNRYWEARSSHGRKPIFSRPSDMWNACVEYFEWVEDNPLIEQKVAQFQGQFVKGTVEKMRAMTISGLCIFLDINISTWFDYAKKDDFSEITTQVEEIIRTQKFTGAAADLFNANIIARDLGLADKKEIDGKLNLSDLTDEQLDARIAALKSEKER